MTITLAWLRRIGDLQELIVASDSRLRSQGAMDQCQKIFPLDRGDCCLGFCGDSQIAYPLFIQTASALNHHLKTRSRALDVVHLSALIGQLLNNHVRAWDLKKKEKSAALSDTRVLFAGWSSENQRFDIGFFKYEDNKFVFHHERMRGIHPWREKRKRSLVFLGDYEADFRSALTDVLRKKYGDFDNKQHYIEIGYDFEPIEALNVLLRKEGPSDIYHLIGGSPQMVKVYKFSNTLPFVVRTSHNEHYLFGRRLFHWEKTEYPILDLTKKSPSVVYPGAAIPLPDKIESNSKALSRQPK